MLMLPEVDGASLRTDESRKHVEWGLCGSAVTDLSKTSGMHIKSFVKINNLHLPFFYIFLMFCPCFAFK
jgi:hypothetical protein